MAIALDQSTTSLGPTPFNFNHTPIGTPAAVILFIIQIDAAADEISNVQYGGVTMTEVATRAQDTGGEPGATYCYFLGSSVPTGTQSVSATDTASNGKNAYCITVTASGDCEVEDSGVAQENSANPSISLTTGVTTFIAGGLHSGRNSVDLVTEGSGYTQLYEHDRGSVTSYVQYQESVASGSPVCNWTAGGDDVAAFAVAIKETATGLTIPIVMHYHKLMAGD